MPDKIVPRATVDAPGLIWGPALALLVGALLAWLWTGDWRWALTGPAALLIWVFTVAGIKDFIWARAAARSVNEQKVEDRVWERFKED